jgi:cellulose biosynthesis protein BcsQ
MQRSKVVLIDCLPSLSAFTMGLYTQLDSYLFTTLQTDFYLSTTRLLDYKDSILLTLST